MNVALYMRVSTQEQSVEAQRTELRSYCAARGWIIGVEVEDTISGSKADRPGLNALMADVRAKKYDAVCAVKIDRMARSLANFAQLAAEFTRCDVALILTSQGIDTSHSNPCGRFQVNVLAAVAEFERDLTRERTRAGLVVARAKGKVIGRTSVVMPSAVERGRIVAEWRAAGGIDYADLGRALGGVNRGTAWRVARQHPAVAA